ncbi:MAG: RsmE family RNA methyltransferase [Spirochaetota bacterium]
MNTVLFDPEELGASPGARLSADDRRARHILDVLGLGPGDSFRAGVVDGPAGSGRVVAVDADGGVTVGFESEPAGELGEMRPLHPVRLLLAHPRPIVLRRMLRDLSTLGVERIVVVRTALGEKSYLESRLWQGDIVRRLLIEGAEQAGSTMLPRVEKSRRLTDAIARVVEGRETAPRVVFDNAGSASGRAGVGGRTRPDGDAAARVIAVGSERGWTDEERNLLGDHGFETLRLGSRILRTETASHVAVAVTLRDLGRI